MDDPQIDSSIRDQKTIFHFCGIKFSLLQTQSEWDNDLQQVRTSRFSLTKTVRGEPSQLADLKKAVSKLKNSFDENELNDIEIRRSLSSASPRKRFYEQR